MAAAACPRRSSGPLYEHKVAVAVEMRGEYLVSAAAPGKDNLAVLPIEDGQPELRSDIPVALEVGVALSCCEHSTRFREISSS